jgi:hypothetical protein
MASMNDLLTVSLVLILLFGAVSLYIYTRIQQCEQKLNLVESILLDIKMSAELREYPDLPNKSESHSSPSSYVEQHVSAAPFQDSEQITATPFEEEETTGLNSSDLSEPEASPETTVVSIAPVAKPSVSVNYESMTLAELKSLAKQRGITGSSSMKRSQILEALHTSDNKANGPADGGILSALAEASSSLTDGDMAVLA